jgi:DNA uptake protein ComE-like DNA-binding protein
VALAVYYADQMSTELRAADNRAAEISAREAVAGGTRYAAYVLSQFAKSGAVPYREDYKSEALPIGDATMWFIGRDNDQKATDEPVFGLIDEASKINVNTAPRSMLEALPGMTPEFADAIISWRSRSGGTSGDNYSRMEPPRLNKGGPFETVDELRLVYGATLEILFGEDINRNGALDDNENDSDTSAPHDNGDGLLQPGVLEYLTVYTREPNTRSNGGRRINVATTQGRQQLRPTLQRLFGGARAAQIEGAMAQIGNTQIRSVAEFCQRLRLNSREFAQLRGEITTSNASTIQGLINVNTASETVLACIPGIGPENAATIAAYRAAHPEVITGSLAWLTQLLPSSNIIRAGPYITDKSYQFSVDVAAVGNVKGRGYCREKTVFDMRTGKPRIIYHQDLTAYGWAVGASARQTLREGSNNRT